MAKVLGPRNPVIPAFINIGQRLEGFGETEEIKALPLLVSSAASSAR